MTLPKGFKEKEKDKKEEKEDSKTKYLKPTADASPPKYEPMARVPRYYQQRPPYQQQQKPKKDVGVFAAMMMIIGAIMILIGIFGVFLSPLDADVTGYGAIGIVGFLIIIGGFLLVTAMSATTAKR